MKTTKEEIAAYKSGCRAHADQVDYEDNPYEKATGEWNAWSCGWADVENNEIVSFD